MFMNLSYLRHSVCRLRVYQLGISCARWSCIAPFSSLDVKDTAIIVHLKADFTAVQEGVTESSGIEPQRSLIKPAVRRYAVVESSLLQYKEKYGDMLVPYSFIIPRDDESWPSETWGMKLGNTVHSIRRGGSYKDKREELANIGFDYSSQSTAHGYGLVKSALLRYKEMYGDMIVPDSFIIPRDDESWPKETWGIKLGRTVSSIRRGHNYKAKQEELIIIDDSLRLQLPKYRLRL